MVSCADRDDRIRPYEANPFYWQYGGRPVLLLGGSVEDNLFQIPDLEEHLDLLRSVGGSFVRCTMSARDPGNVQPFARDEATGLYDLERWNDEYWRRFRTFLELTAEREIIPQIEFWATYDYYGYQSCWAGHPFNPANNVNYTAEESGLSEVVDYRQHTQIQPFFETVPALEDLPVARRYQEAYVEKLLSISLEHDHVLYCMDNETNADPQWSCYWAEFVKAVAERAGRTVEVTEMWNMWDPTGGAVPGVRIQTDRRDYLERSCVRVTLDNPDLYSFVEISNTNTQLGPTHYEATLWVRRQLEERGTPKPVNCDKIYGADPTVSHGGPPVIGEERFWRNVFAGVAAVRFHRPPTGLALSELARAHIRSMRTFTDELGIFTCEPRPDLIRDEMGWGTEAYCLADPGRAYAVCFPNGGAVQLDCSAAEGDVSMRWLDVRASRWTHEEREPAGDGTWLSAPSGAFWAVLIRPSDG
jgi:hypothetical protein